MPTKFLFLFCLFGIGVVWAEAQNGGSDLSPADRNSYDIKQYNSENGLPQNSATGLLLDKNNFLWITTQNGLVRFDGRRFRTYDKSNTPAIRSNRFSVIAESSQKEVLLGSSFDPSEIYKVGPDYKVVVDTARTRIAHKFLQINSTGIFDCTPLFNYYAGASSGIDTVFLDSLCSSETYLILNNNEIVVRDSKNEWYYLNNVSAEVNKLPVAIQNEGVHIFVLQGIFCVFSERGEWRFFKHGREKAIQVDKTVSALLKTAFSSSGQKLIIGRPGGDHVIVRDQNDIYELSLHNNVLKAELIFPNLKILDELIATSFLFDKKNHRLFIATVTTGFFIVTKRLFKAATFNSPNRLDNAFKAFLLLPNKNILTSSGILDKSNEKDQLLFKEDMRPDGNCIYKARDRTIWISRDNQLHIYDSNFSRELAVDSLQLDAYISCIIEDSGHTIWVSTLSSLLKIEGGKLQYVFKHHPFFVNHSIESITEVSPTAFWIASRDGIYEYDKVKKSIGEKAVLPHVYARNFYRAKDNSIWIATYGNGYYKYHMGKFIAFPVDPQNFLSTAHAFLEDDLGFFWISTNHGLFRVRKKDMDDFAAGRTNSLYYYHINKSSGFNTNEFNGGCSPASQKDEEGNFYFPSLDGIVYFNPGRVQPEMPDRGIFVDELFVDTLKLDYRKTHSINPDFHRLIVDVTTPFFGLEENLKLEYTLDSNGGKWYPVNRDGRITINRLPHGKYALLVRKHNGSAENRFTHMAIAFEVLPHWYNTWLFYALVAIVASGLLFFLYRLRTRILLRQNLRLQMKVDERTAELEQSTKIKERLLSVIMHDMRSPMFSQALLIDHLHKNFYRFNEVQLNELFFLLKDSSNRLCQFSTDFLIWYDSQKQGFSIKSEDIELNDFIKETTVIYESIALRKGLYFSWDIPSGLVLISDRNMLAIVIRNLVDNAVKYTGSGSIGISAFQNDGHIQIQVKDTGQGMTALKIAEIRSFNESDTNTAGPTFGYRFILELARRLNGEVEIDSAPAKGTTVVVSFKV
ncbi:MAG TPA: ATP-binding protein [Puia sp.]|jgi:signal transduction histidine kinase/ligand-binding sensor domain-containing protein